MAEENQDLSNSSQNKTAIIRLNLFEYGKIIALSFIFPMWVVIVINGITTLLKMMHWLKLDVKFWTDELYSSLTLILLIIIPIGYLIWFYHLTFKKALIQIHKDLLVDWNIEIGRYCAKHLIASAHRRQNGGQGIEIETILVYVNKKLSYLPKRIRWLARKLIDKIPFVELLNAFDYKDLKEANEEALSKSITKKINEFEINYIELLIPKWGMLIVPINLIFLIIYISL